MKHYMFNYFTAFHINRLKVGRYRLFIWMSPEINSRLVKFLKPLGGVSVFLA